MKKIGYLAAIVALIVLASGSFAQPEEFEAAELESCGMNESIGYGFYGTVPTVKYHFTSDISAQAGIGFSKVSTSGYADSSTTVLLQAESIYLRLGDTNIKYGAFASVLHNPSDSIVLAGTFGAEKRISSNINLSLDIIPVSVYVAGRASPLVFGILSGAVISGHFYF
jgi:hypothetical protein